MISNYWIPRLTDFLNCIVEWEKHYVTLFESANHFVCNSVIWIEQLQFDYYVKEIVNEYIRCWNSLTTNIISLTMNFDMVHRNFQVFGYMYI
jgi:hypothetical protein